jgi:drug/metabolite transporter (DMT)-like permease
MIILAYIFYFATNAVGPLQRRWLATRKNEHNDGQITLAFWVAAITAVCGLILPWIVPTQWSGDISTITILTLICAIGGATFLALSYIAQKYIEAGVTILALATSTPTTIILASLLLGETLAPLQYLGAAALLIGILIVSTQHRQQRWRLDRYFVMMLVAGVLLGVALTAERALQRETGFTAATLLAWWSQAIVLGLFILIRRERHSYSIRDTIITGGLRFLQSLSWVSLIFIVGNLSLTSAVTTFRVVVVFVTGALFLRERDHLIRKIIGSLIAIAGLLLMR